MKLISNGTSSRERRLSGSLAREKLRKMKGKFMKKKDDEMRDEYDLSEKKGVRGKYYKAYGAGHSVRVYNGDKLIRDEYFAAIDPAVREYFPDSKSINKALKNLISLIPDGR